MALDNQLHVGTVGAFLRWTIHDSGVPLDVSAASTKDVTIKKPDGTTTTKTLAFSTKSGDAGDGTDGRVEYSIESGVLDQSGIFKWQIKIIISGWTDYSNVGEFLVKPVL